MVKKMRSALTAMLLSASLVLLADAEVVRFKAAKPDVNLTLKPEQRGYTLQQDAEGLRINFVKFAKGKTTPWPYIGVRGKALKIRDWRPYKYLIVRIRSLDSNVSPTGQIVVRDARGKLAGTPVRLRCNAVSDFAVPLDKITAAGVDLSKINLLQLAMPDCAHNISFVLISAHLTGSPVSDDPEELIPSVFDITSEIAAGKIGSVCYGETTLCIRDGKPVIEMKRYRNGMDQWPGLTLNTRTAGMMLGGDWSTKTHIQAELELLDGDVKLGFSFTDDSQKKFWHSLGSLDRNQPTVMDRQIYDMGEDLKRIVSLTLSCTRPEHDGIFRINSLRLEFRPETVSGPVTEKLKQIAALDLNDNERNRLRQLKTSLDGIYAKVKGEKAKRRDIEAFFRICEETKQKADALLRINRLRVVRENMKDHPYAAGIVDSMTSAFIENKGFLMQPAKKAMLELARNEYESFQVAIVPFEAGKKKYTVSVSPLRNQSGDEIPVETALVGFAEAKRMTYPAEYTGWYPDFIISTQRDAWIGQNEIVPFWVRIHTDKNTPAGIYRASVTVSGENVKPYSFPLEVKVWDFVLPDGSPLPTAFNVPGQLHQMFKAKKGKEIAEIHQKFARLAASYKLYYDRLYFGPYGTPEYVTGIWKELNGNNLMQSFCICNTTPHPKYTKDRSDPDDPGVNRLLKDIQRHMAEFGKNAKEAGFYSRAYFYGFDEWKIDEVTNKVFGFLKKNYPKIPVMTTANVPRADLPGLENIDIWVPTATRYANHPELVAALRKRGIKIWWYICNFPRPPKPSFMLEVPAAVPRVFMGIMTQKYQPEGFLYWALISWPKKQLAAGPVTNPGPKTEWNPNTCGQDNEEGNFFVPGANGSFYPTIRAENFRDGVEDLWYYRILEKRIRDKRRQAPAELIG